MTLCPRVSVLLFATVFAASPLAFAGDNEIHQCVDAEGAVTFQNDPCPEAPPEPPAPKTSPAKPKPAPRVVPRVVPPRQPPRPVRITGPVDPLYASAERTWRTFVAAMKAADRAAARACLTSAALEDLGPFVDSQPPEKLRETVDALGAIEFEGEVGPFWSLRASGAHGRSRWIFLERTDNGEWKISAF